MIRKLWFRLLGARLFSSEERDESGEQPPLTILQVNAAAGHLQDW